MKIRIRKPTVRDFVEAMRKNGYEQGFGSYIIRDGEDKVIVACAIGQAALNLNLNDPPALHSAFRNLADKHNFIDQPDIVRLNDREMLPLHEIADQIEKWARMRKIYSKRMRIEFWEE